MKFKRFRNGLDQRGTVEDIPMVCKLGHTLWYTSLAQANKCDMGLPPWGVEACASPLRRLTDFEQAAWEIGGYAAVAAIVMP